MQQTKLQLKKIKDFGRVVTGKTPPTKNQEYYGNRYPFITPTDISDSSIYAIPERYLSEEGAQKVASSKLPKNSVCYTCIASVGKIAITEEESFTNQQINSIIVDPQKADYRYVFYLLKNITPEIKGMVGGAASPIINKSAFESIDVDVLNLEAQKSVADVLFAYDQFIENNTKRIKILEEIAQAIYKEWLVPSASKKWKIATLRDVIESYTGGGWGKEELDKDYSGPAYVIRGTDIPHASMGNISTCPLRYHKLSNLRARVLQDGDLVFEVSGGSKGQPVGRSLLVTTKLLDQFKQNVICASFCKLIRPDKNKISPFQMYEQILNWYENGVVEKYQVQSTGISNFRFESFIDEEKIILPPEETRKKFDKLMSPLFDEIYALGSQNHKLRQARDLLLPKLVTGELEIKS